MATFAVKIEGMERLRVFIGRQSRVISKPFSAGTARLVVAQVKKSIREEFSGSFWKRPGGSRKPWKAVKTAFRKGAKKPFRGLSGSLYKAWRSASVTSSATQVSITASHPGLAMHRGGTGTSARLKNTRVTVTPASRYAIAGKTGVWLNRSTRHVVIPSRPHATANPDLLNKVRDIIIGKLKRSV